MSKFYKAIIFGLPLFFCMANNTKAQSFKKGSVLINVSEGSTYATYTATNINTDVVHATYIEGCRDPLTVEYGITDKWGIGINMGGDIYQIDPAKFYDFKTSEKVKSIMSELTLDANYHFYATRHTDLAAFGSLGFSSVSMTGDDGDFHYQYKSGGMIIRAGMKARYYFRKRFGATGMLSGFATQCSPEGVKGNTVANNYTTSIKGYALEIGLCYRIRR